MTELPDEVYSNDKETFHADFGYVVGEFEADLYDEPKYGDTQKIYLGEPKAFKLSGFVTHSNLELFVDGMKDDMYEKAPIDLVDEWGLKPDQAISLEKELKQFLDDWADKNNAHPNFYEVVNIREQELIFAKDGWQQ